MGAVHGRQVGAVLIAKLDRCTRSVADLASLIDTFQPPRGGTYQCRRVSGHQQRRRAPRGQRARRRGAVGTGSNRRAHVSRYSNSRAAPPAGWRPTVSSSSTGAGHGTRASRKHSRPSSSTAAPASHGRKVADPAQRHRAPHPHRRPVDAPGRPPGATGRANGSTAPQRRAPGADSRGFSPVPPAAPEKRSSCRAGSPGGGGRARQHVAAGQVRGRLQGRQVLEQLALPLRHCDHHFRIARNTVRRAKRRP